MGACPALGGDDSADQKYRSWISNPIQARHPDHVDQQSTGV
jgi:hypothetical protein